MGQLKNFFIFLLFSLIFAERNEQREIFAAKMFQRLFSLPEDAPWVKNVLTHSSQKEHRKNNKKQENFIFNELIFETIFKILNLRVPPELASLRLNSGSFRICDLNSDHFVSQTEADRCSSNYFKNINREHIPIYHNRQRFIKFEFQQNLISIININLS